MDWIERLFHVSLDGGDGSLELGIVFGAAIALAMMVAGAVKLIPAVRSWVTGRSKRADAVSVPHANRSRG